VKQQIAFYASTPAYELVLSLHDWEGIAPELRRKAQEGDWTGMTRLISDEMLDAVAVSGSYESIGKKIRERYTGLLDRIALYQPYKVSANDASLAALVKELSN
jgi:hypothetical protein